MKLFTMKLINFKLFFLVAVFFIYSFGKNEVDLIVINAKIYTVDNNFSIAKSMAIKNGQIIDIDVKNLDSKYTSTKIVDLNGLPEKLKETIYKYPCKHLEILTTKYK